LEFNHYITIDIVNNDINKKINFRACVEDDQVSRSFLSLELSVSFSSNASECHILGYLLLYFASCVNPIIYVIMNKQYRQAYAGVIGCSWIRASLTPYGSSAPCAGQHVHQDFAQGNFQQRHAVTLTKL
jgi:hypothetical protein